MSDDEDYNSEEDLDYVPEDAEQLSEEENSGDEEDLSLLHDGEDGVKAGSVRKKGSGKKKKSLLIEARKRKGGIKLNVEEEGQDESLISSKKEDEEVKRKEELEKQIEQDQEQKKEEKEKKRADDLWSSFLSDTKKPTPRPTQSSSSGGGLGSLSSQIKSSPQTNVKDRLPSAGSNAGEKGGKVTITKVFDFAGEEVKITKEVDADSKEGIAEQKKLEKMDKEKEESATPQVLSNGPALPSALKRPAVGGLGSLLSKISKKSKMGTLEKSKLDWNSFKQKEGIEEDLKIHNKGKQGYTERMAFLNRTDQKQYELERDVRLGKTSKR